jgi:hypothetical protein
MKAFPTFLFVASFLIVGSLVIALSGCTPPQKEPKISAQQPKTETAKSAEISLPLIKKDGPISVDFDNAPLSEVVLFVTNTTGKGFVLNGADQKPITWIEFSIPREKLLDSFANTLAAFGLTLKPNNEEKTVFTVDKVEEQKVPCKLHFATGKLGTFFMLGSTIYPARTIPYQVKYDAGHWYAIVPKSVADQFNTTEGKQNAKI